MLVFVFLSMLLERTHSQHYFVLPQNYTNSYRSMNVSDSEFVASRQYSPSITEAQFVQPFEQNSGYYYPSAEKVQLQQHLTPQHFSHDNKLRIYMFHNKLSLYCAADSTYERITWRKYSCPNEIGTHAGEIIAMGPMVSNPHLYGVNSFGRNEEYVSELLLKHPFAIHTDGAYICEGTFISETYPHAGMTTIRDIVIIGGKKMYENCFPRVEKSTLLTARYNTNS